MGEAARRPRPAAPMSALLKGSTRLPSPVVPSAKSTMMSPAPTRRPIASVAAPVWLRRVRSMKSVRCRRASVRTTGQPPTSALATKDTGSTLLITGTSSQETWFMAIRSGGVGRLARHLTRMPSSAQAMRCQ